MKQEQAWKRGKFHANYQQFRQGRNASVYVPSLEYLRACTRDRTVNSQVRAMIAADVEQSLPTVLRPPSGLRERNHEQHTMLDELRTISGALN